MGSFFLRFVVLLIVLQISCGFQFSVPKTPRFGTFANSVVNTAPTGEITAKQVTKEIMGHFTKETNSEEDSKFSAKLQAPNVSSNIDGMNVLTLMFQCARAKKKVTNFITSKLILDKLQKWDREWNEREISAFMYGIQSLECIDTDDSEVLKFAAQKIASSSAKLSSRALGNSLYGLHRITSDVEGVPELVYSIAEKIRSSPSDMNGQDIGIGVYGMQGLSTTIPEINALVEAIAMKIESSPVDLDDQAVSNVLYGLQVRFIFILFFE
jgi:hypothetical protein